MYIVQYTFYLVERGTSHNRPSSSSTTIRCHLVVEHHGSLTALSSLTASALQGHPSQQSRKKEREKRRRRHPTLLPAAPLCASSTNFSTVSAPHPSPTNSTKTEPEKPRRRRVLAPLPIMRDVSARVRQLEPLHSSSFSLCLSLPLVSFSPKSIIFHSTSTIPSPNTRIIRIHSDLLVVRSRPLLPTTSIPSLSTLQQTAPRASRACGALGADGGT